MEENKKSKNWLQIKYLHIVRKSYIVMLQKYQALYGGTPEGFLVHFVALLFTAFAGESQRQMSDFCPSK